jgi:hypothetical protein
VPLYTGAPPGTATDRVAYFRYDAMGPNAGKFSDKDDVDIVFNCLVDFEDIWTGWGLLEKGIPPVWTWDPAINTPAPQPGKGYRRAFSLRVFFDGARGIRELTSTNRGLFAAFAKIYDGEFEGAAERRRGLVPRLELTDVVSSETSFGTVIDPVFAIFGWEARPPELTPRGAPPAPAAPVNATGPVVPAVRDDLDDDIPFVTCDPAREPYLRRRSIA